MKKGKTYNLATINLVMWVFIISGLILISSFTDISSKRDSDTIQWSHDYKLKISDFTQMNYIDGNIPANASTGIFMSYSRKLERYKAVAIFDKKRSGWNTRLIKHPDWVLNHEQRHFDITQFIVNELNKELSVVPYSMSQELFYKYEHKLDSMQVLYDTQTMHSMDSTYQDFWNKKIDYLLYTN